MVVLRQGDRVPADARIMTSTSFKANEAVLTGESMPVEKSSHAVAPGAAVGDRTSMVFMGTLVEEGTAKALVTATGLGTEFGGIAGMIVRERRHDVTPLQVRLHRLATTLGAIFLGISALLFVMGVVTGRDPLTMFLTSVAVAVAAVPESLPVSLSIVLAIGARRILRSGGLVRKMAAAEALGSVTVIATDKTVTLTEGKMNIDRIILSDGREIFSEQFMAAIRDRTSLSDILERLALVSNAFVENPGEPQDRWRFSGSAIDKAILRSLVRAGIYADVIARTWPRLAEIPFHARKKFSASLNAGTTGAILTVLGAPEVIAARCGNPENREAMIRRASELAAKGFRVLATAYRPMSWKEGDALTEDAAHELIFDGLIIFSDPIRHDVKEMIQVAQQAGIRVIMVTGDHAQTAQYVGQQLGILSTPDRFIEGAHLPDDAAVIVEQYDVFARVTPEHKVRIVDGLKQQGHSVAMIGDGVNDAPSLLRSDIGVAVGSGTEVAKEASDLVLLNDSFSIVVQAIRQGRIIFDNIRKVALFLLSDAFTEMILIGGSMLFGLPLPLLPAQILWVNIIEDVLPAVALAWDRGDEDIMRQPPRRIGELFSRGIRRFIVMFSIITSGSLFGLFLWLTDHGSLDHARTMVFVLLGITSLVYVFSVRSLSRPVWKMNPFGNRFLVGAVVIGFVLYAVAIYVPPIASVLAVEPLTRMDWALVGTIAVFNITAFELAKRIFLNGLNHRSA